MFDSGNGGALGQVGSRLARGRGEGGSEAPFTGFLARGIATDLHLALRRGSALVALGARGEIGFLGDACADHSWQHRRRRLGDCCGSRAWPSVAQDAFVWGQCQRLPVLL